ncbi:WAP four-disulfide core domain protein 2-like [Hydractinia symbiolongicarpus]|uniref:WAP four-disulfide core domain protein 2-like n=1 Tax=Hydractinia symbiolongicarpus TaxID=13093 RepID=UPI002549D404|nr:WAP four-disulfide core domain protein 2-like [Hydractinia symbiolongicarpus]
MFFSICELLWLLCFVTVCGTAAVELDDVKPGMCPDRIRTSDIECTPIDTYDSFCLFDTDCRGKEKCCSDGCYLVCTKPNTSLKPTVIAKTPTKNKKDSLHVKPGVCPFVIRQCRPGQVFVESCLLDDDCSGTKKCCSDGCNLVCTNVASSPPKKTKKASIADVELGKCPVVRRRRKKACPPVAFLVAGCLFDNDCSGTRKCCSDGCNLVCTNVASSPPKKTKKATGGKDGKQSE